MKINILVILFVIGIFTSQYSFAQKLVPISLNEVLSLVDANNLKLKNYQLQADFAEADLADKKAWWLPDLYGGFSVHSLSGAGMNTDGRFAIETQRDNMWMGLGLDLDWNLAEGLFQTRAAKKAVNSIHYKSEIDRNKITLGAIERYYDLLTAQLELHSYQESIRRFEAVANQLEIRVKGGIAYESDWLLAKSNLNQLKSEAISKKMDWEKNSADLASILNLNPAHQWVITDSILSKVDLINDEALLGEGDLNKRPEISFYENEVEVIKEKKKEIKQGLLLPQFRVNGYLSYFGDLNNDIIPLDPIQFPTTDRLYPTRAINADLMWRLPLGDLLYKGETKKFDSQVLLVQNNLEMAKAEINSEIQFARNLILQAKEQIELTEEGSEFALEALNQNIAREENGIVRPLEILQAQQMYIDARMAHIRAVNNYNVAAYKYYVAIGNKL